MALSGFELTSIESIEERDWLHRQIYQQPGGLNQYTWAGETRYRGAPRQPSGQALIFGVWNDPRGLQLWPDEWYSAFVCETSSDVELGGRSLERPDLPAAGVYSDDAMLYGNHLYVFAERGRTLEQAISFCNSLERRVNGRAYPAFQMLRIERPEEQAKVHALIQANGGAWTWAGKPAYQGALDSVDGYGLVFTQWDRPDILTQQPVRNKYAVVCESVGD